MVWRAMCILIPTLSPWLPCGVVLEFFYMLSLIFTISVHASMLFHRSYADTYRYQIAKTFATASLENLFYSASTAQKEHEEKSISRTISQRLEPFVAAIDQYGVARDVYTNTYSLAMAPLWGSIRVLLHVKSNLYCLCACQHAVPSIIC